MYQYNVCVYERTCTCTNTFCLLYFLVLLSYFPPQPLLRLFLFFFLLFFLDQYHHHHRCYSSPCCSSPCCIVGNVELSTDEDFRLDDDFNKSGKGGKDKWEEHVLPGMYSVYNLQGWGLQRSCTPATSLVPRPHLFYCNVTMGNCHVIIAGFTLLKHSTSV